MRGNSRTGGNRWDACSQSEKQTPRPGEGEGRVAEQAQSKEQGWRKVKGMRRGTERNQEQGYVWPGVITEVGFEEGAVSGPGAGGRSAAEAEPGARTGVGPEVRAVESWSRGLVKRRSRAGSQMAAQEPSLARGC